jgi:diguanylate cyclase (GGDEF)-like protein/PAS domain S-box-containing protein
VTAEAYRKVFDALDEGFCVVEIIEDASGVPVDYRFLETNAAFEHHTGIRGARGRTILDLVPDIEPHWIEIYGQVAQTGEPARFEAQTDTSSRHVWFDEYAFRLGGRDSRRVAIHFRDITQRKRVEEELRFRGQQFQTLVEQAPFGIVLLDGDLRLVEVNPAARPAFGDIGRLVGRDYGEVLRIVWPDALAQGILQILRTALATGEGYHDPEMVGVRRDRGTVEHYDWRADRIPLPDGRDGVVCYFRETSAQVAARQAIAASEARFRMLFASIDEGFCILEVLLDQDGSPIDARFLEVNPAFGQQTGTEAALGHTLREIVPTIEPFWIDALGTVALTGEARRFTEFSAPLGRWFEVYAFRIEAPPERKVAVLVRDVSERKRAEAALVESEAKLRHRAHHDALTGLPNRVVLEDRLRLALAAAERHARVLALLFVDLDGFKSVNDGFGHAAGDAVLAEVARRLQATLRVGDTLARLHGDEFVVLLPEVSTAGDAGRLARDLLAEVARPIGVEGRELILSASIGVSVYPDDAREAEQLLRAADVAMYRAKLAGKNAVNYFGASLHERALGGAGIGGP